MADPIRVGILDDMTAGPDSIVDPRWLRLAADEAVRAGRLDREVEFVAAHALGLPAGTAAAAERAYRSLVERDVLLVLGPAIGDNALALTPLAEALAVPTINWAGAERARGSWMFHLQVGSHEDESILLARHLAAAGRARAGVLFDRSPIGRRHLAFFAEEADRLGLHPPATATIGPLAQVAEAEVAGLIAAGVDALVYLGLGLAAPAVADAVARGGWTYVDLYSDANATLAALLARTGTPREGAFAAAVGHDLGRLMTEGLARAPELTRGGVREGLERVKWLPAAEGEEGTLLGFGVHERAALHGRYLVLREWRDGRSVEPVRA